jgi:hypothetical protein
MFRTTVAVLLAAGALVASAAAWAESAPVTATAPPWSDPSHMGPLEVYASGIAAAIARRQVTVECDDDATWQSLVGDHGVGLTGELGIVDWVSSTDHTVQSVDTVAHLAPAVCTPLQAFATAASKPTNCRATARGPLRPCFGARRELDPADGAYWRTYDRIAEALLTLAHESFHLRGVVGGIVDGVQVGDPRAEAKAECWGMQELPYVAEKLGASRADAHAIARYSYDVEYPRERGTVYWSAACVPGGGLDARPGRTGPWP